MLARRAWALESGKLPRARIGATAIAGPHGLGAAIARVVAAGAALPDVVFVACDDSDAAQACVTAALVASRLAGVRRVDLGLLLGYGYLHDVGHTALAMAVEGFADPRIGLSLVIGYADAVGGAVVAVIREPG